ncbi:MAG: hypothetical protein M1826_007046 [Phylliscum demangeonii]|nr:MAG: hypothetical protein M1826_007046 [Phylliscum demangeonii]
MGEGSALAAGEAAGYRVYKRRWFGLAQLALLNVIVSWDWLSFSAVSTTSAAYFGVSETAINWLSTAFLFAFCAISPLTLWTLHKGGPKRAIVVASLLIFIGNWVRYAGARAGRGRGHFGVVMFGQIVIGLAQPFVLAAPTRYSAVWFTASGRISATAFASLANPLGGALGQLINPFLATKPSEIPNMLLYVAIIGSVASVPSLFIPGAPPTPPCASAAEARMPLGQTARALAKSPEFWLLFIPFSVYAGFFNAFASLLNQILYPYGYSESQAGICGALLIVTGVVFAAISSPLIERYAQRPGLASLPLLAIKAFVPVIALSYAGFIWAPAAHGLAAPYALAALLGLGSFAMVPLALELLVDVTHPVSAEITSVAAWTGGSLLGGVFLFIMNALKAGPQAAPPANLRRALVFEAVVAVLIMPLPWCLGCFGRRAAVGRRRLHADRRDEGRLSHGLGPLPPPLPAPLPSR